MKISKKLLAAAMATIVGVASFGATATTVASFSVANALTEKPDFATDIEGTDLWYVYGNNQLTIGGTGVIPQLPFTSTQKITILEGVTGIGEHAFNSFNLLESIVIPKTVSYIGGYAFVWCGSLRSIEIPNSVTEIGDGIFGYCRSLKDVVLPNALTKIGGWFFDNCSSLKTINIPDTVEIIGDRAFNNCDSLEHVDIPNNVYEIGSSAFAGCDSLKSIDLSDSVTRIGKEAFQHCNSLQYINIPNKVSKIYEHTFSYCPQLERVNIPNSVTEIESQAFYNNTNLKSIVIPNSVTKVGYRAFGKCESLETVVIPDSVISIGEHAFEGVGRYSSPCTLVLESPRVYDPVLENGKWYDGYFKVQYGNASSVTTTPSTSTPTTTTSQTASSSSNLKGSITIDTANYKMDKGNRYQIGVNIQNDGKRLSGAEVKVLINKGTLKVTDSRTGSIVDLKQLDNGDFLVTGKNYGSCYIVYTIYDNSGKEVNHASVKIDVEAGVKQGGEATRNTSLFDESLLS